MKLDKKDILKALETITIAGEGKNMVESGAVKNVVTFGDEVIIDLVLSTPAMHIKKRAFTKQDIFSGYLNFFLKSFKKSFTILKALMSSEIRLI